MNDVAINISQLHTLLTILRYRIGAKFFEPKSKLTDLCGEINVPQFGEYKYSHEGVRNPELILNDVRDYVAIFKKKLVH